MLRIGLIREGKVPPDTRVAFTPQQCRYILDHFHDVDIVVEPAPVRCFSDAQYEAVGVRMSNDLTDRDVLFGIKEVPISKLIPGKTYCFFSHTKKAQPYNQPLMRALLDKGIRLIDYECLTHADGQRILGFGLFAGIVGAHNGLRTWGKKTGLFDLPTAHSIGFYEALRTSYAGLKLPAGLKIAVTGSGKVASGVVEVMAHLDVELVEPEDYVRTDYDYPVYVLLKGRTLYTRRGEGIYHRDDFHKHPESYHCLFPNYLPHTDILMNGIYWVEGIPRLFTPEDIRRRYHRLSVIADITCDENGSVPINLGASTIADPVYGVDRMTGARAEPYQPGTDTIDVMAVDNLPNELPRDASQYFGDHLIKYVLPEMLKERSDLLERATMCSGGALTPAFSYLEEYARGSRT